MKGQLLVELLRSRVCQLKTGNFEPRKSNFVRLLPLQIQVLLLRVRFYWKFICSRSFFHGIGIILLACPSLLCYPGNSRLSFPRISCNSVVVCSVPFGIVDFMTVLPRVQKRRPILVGDVEVINVNWAQLVAQLTWLEGFFAVILFYGGVVLPFLIVDGIMLFFAGHVLLYFLLAVLLHLHIPEVLFCLEFVCDWDAEHLYSSISPFLCTLELWVCVFRLNN